MAPLVNAFTLFVKMRIHLFLKLRPALIARQNCHFSPGLQFLFPGSALFQTSPSGLKRGQAMISLARSFSDHDHGILEEKKKTIATISDQEPKEYSARPANPPKRVQLPIG